MASIINIIFKTSQPAFTFIIAIAIGYESFSKRKGLGVILTILGAIFVTLIDYLVYS